MHIKKISNTIYELHEPKEPNAKQPKKHTLGNLKDMLSTMLKQGCFGAYNAFSLENEDTSIEQVKPGTRIIAHTNNDERLGHIDAIDFAEKSEKKTGNTSEVRANISIAHDTTGSPKDEYEIFISSQTNGTTLLSIQTVEHFPLSKPETPSPFNLDANRGMPHITMITEQVKNNAPAK